MPTPPSPPTPGIHPADLIPKLTRALAFTITLTLAVILNPLPAIPQTGPFDIPRPGRTFAFPRDHGSHPEFRIEWWYITGHLWDASSNRFGFQSTFFRTAAPPSPLPTPHATPTFGADHLFLAHAALLNTASGTFSHRERLHRQGWAAGAATHSLHVWNETSSLTLLPDPDPDPSSNSTPTTTPALRLVDTLRTDAAWDLTLSPAKPLVIFGTNGVSRKGASPSAASHYLTFPRLLAHGTLTLASSPPRPVHGIAWMDHEFGSSQLAPDQTGWDWLSIQLHDGREIMAYRLRKTDGSTDPFSTLAWIDRSGAAQHLPPSAFQLQPLASWSSPRSGATYPSGFRLITPDPSLGTDTVLHIVPLLQEQEMPGRIGDVPYWEGACRVLTPDGQERGVAFVELAGYAGNLSRSLR
jgi:predicted secreted hydrolase